MKDGESIDELLGRSKLLGKQTLTKPPSTGALLKDVLGLQIIAALHQSAHEDVSTVAEAFEAADKNKINVREISDPATGEQLTVIDYGAGGNTYGAVFKKGEVIPSASIRDGDLLLK